MLPNNTQKNAAWCHYGWIIISACTVCVAVSLGFGRFALGMLLPAMGESLPLDYAQMGFISTGNFIAYTFGVMSAVLIVPILGERWTITGSLLLVALSLLAVSHASGFYSLLIIYSITGLAGGCANITGLGLVSHWFNRRLRGQAAGFQVSGSSFAIIFAGLVLPQINLSIGPEGWRDGWTLLGWISILGACFTGLVLRNRPEDIGREPAGISENPSSLTSKANGHPSARIVVHMSTIYFFFGMTYSVYVTFMVTSLIEERGLNEITAGQFWATLGLITLISGPAFGFISDKFGRHNAFALAFFVYGIAYALAAINGSSTCQWASVIFFGIAGWSIPAIVGAAVGDYSTPRSAVKVLGTVTVWFSMGQVIGPTLGGILAKLTDSFIPGYWAITGAAAVAILISITLPSPHRIKHD